jgi:hypothetical protein
MKRSKTKNDPKWQESGEGKFLPSPFIAKMNWFYFKFPNITHNLDNW